jgi:plasmid replication initiation protein
MATKLELIKIDSNKPAADLHVNMSNQLIRTAQGLSLAEKRVVSICMAKLDSVRLDNGRYKFSITAQEYGETFGVTDQAGYMQLKDVGKRLMHRVAQHVEEGRRGKVIRRWVWVAATEYHEGEGYITLTFNHEMTPHLFMLRKEFTSYKLKHAVALRSIYSWRLFELLMQFKGTGILRISVEDFCHAMEAPETARNNYAELVRRIIGPAVKELIEKDDMLIEWQGTKTGGRKVTGLEFRFEKNPQRSLELKT